MDLNPQGLLLSPPFSAEYQHLLTRVDAFLALAPHTLKLVQAILQQQGAQPSAARLFVPVFPVTLDHDDSAPHGFVVQGLFEGHRWVSRV